MTNETVRTILFAMLQLAAVVAIFADVNHQAPDNGIAGFDLSGSNIPIAQVKADRVVIVGATWCAPCQRLKPTIKQVKSEGYDVNYIDIESWKGEEVSSVPTTFYYRGTTPLSKTVGLWTAEQFKSRVIKPL